jgi:aminomethyltransferase
MENSHSNSILTTPLSKLHLSQGAKMIEFADYLMPLQYEGIVVEHCHTRTHCSLFDVSHMGQAWVVGDDFQEVALALQAVIPADLLSLTEGKMRYTTLLNEQGGIIDDLIITRLPENFGHSAFFHLVVNASRKVVDYSYLTKVFKAHNSRAKLHTLDNFAAIALQGPKSLEILVKLNSSIADIEFMRARSIEISGIECWISRSGYTGEIGFEIATEKDDIEKLTQLLLDFDEVKMAGLGARDSLRLEAGLPLYGNDMNDTITPVEANLSFVLNKKRRESADFAGAEKIIKQLKQGTKQLRVGLDIEGRAPLRQRVQIMLEDKQVGVVTSGCFSPTLQKPIACAYVDSDYINSSGLMATVRDKKIPVKVGGLVFVPTRYK